MAELESLLSLHDHVAQQRDAARRLADASQAALRAAAAQVDQLLAYRSEYEQRWHDSFQRGGEIQIVVHYQSFMSRLQAAIDQQRQIRMQIQVQHDRAVERLRALELRLAATAKLIERRRHAAGQAASRREQKQTDEFASRAVWASRRSLPPLV